MTNSVSAVNSPNLVYRAGGWRQLAPLPFPGQLISGSASLGFSGSGRLQVEAVSQGVAQPIPSLQLSYRSSGLRLLSQPPIANDYIAGTATISFGHSANLSSTNQLILGQTTLLFGGSATPSFVAGITGTAGLTLGASATGATRSSLIGAAGLSLNVLGLLRGKGALAGASSPAFSTAGVLDGGGSIAGSAGLQFSAQASAAESGGEAVGRTTIAFSRVARLTGKGALAGSADLSITARLSARSKPHVGQPILGGFQHYGMFSARFIYPIPAVEQQTLVGQTSVGFSASADLTSAGSGVIVGQSALDFDATGAVLRAKGTLQGITQPAFAATGNLGNAAGDDIFGTAGLNFTTSSILKANGTLAGTASLGVSSQADLRANLIYGQGPITLTGVGALTYRNNIPATASITFSGSALWTAKVLIYGSARITFQRNRIAGAGAISLGASGKADATSFGWLEKEGITDTWTQEGDKSSGWTEEDAA